MALTPAAYAGFSALAWTLTAISTIIIALRIFVRVRVRAIGAEDYLMVLTWCCVITVASLFQSALATAFRGGDINVKEFFNKGTSMAVLLYSGGLFAKASVAMLLLRLIGRTSRWQRVVIISTLVAYAVSTALAFVTAIIPPCDTKLSTQQTLPDGTCMADGMAWVALVQLWNLSSAFLDILYSLLATVVIYKLQVSKKKKLSLIVVLSLGYLTAIMATWRAVGVWVYSPEAKQVLNVVVISLEANMMIICGSLPTLGPLVEKWRTGKPLSPRGTGPASYPVYDPTQRPSGLQIRHAQHARERSLEELLSPIERGAAHKGTLSEGILEMKPVSRGDG